MKGRFIVALLALLSVAVPVSAASPIPPPADALPGARTVFGNKNIRYAWLVNPTDRYPHGVFGAPLTAGGLRVMFHDGRTAEVTLPADQVFEDLEPRIVDIDGDGRDEVMVVRSRLDKGAALAIYGEKEACDGDAAGRTLALLGETRPVGQPNRWLNPIAVADFDGDGRPEIALLRTPHLGGVLEIHRFSEGRLIKSAELAGYSNHVFGSRTLRLAAAADMNGDGAPEIVVPTQDRKSVAVIRFADDGLQEIRREALPAAAVGEFSVISPQTTGAPKDRPVEVWIGLENGERYILTGQAFSPHAESPSPGK
jgi:hypothetical protein